MSFMQNAALEKELQEEPTNLKLWLKLIDTVTVRVNSSNSNGSGSGGARNCESITGCALSDAQVADAQQINLCYERALIALPYSYKLWNLYLKVRVHQVDKALGPVRVLNGTEDDGEVSDGGSKKTLGGGFTVDGASHAPAVIELFSTTTVPLARTQAQRATCSALIQEVVQVFERALKNLAMMPNLWLRFAEFQLYYVGSVQATQETFDRALSTLPLEQHGKIWTEGIKPATTMMAPQVADTCWYKYCLYKNTPRAFADHLATLVDLGLNPIGLSNNEDDGRASASTSQSPLSSRVTAESSANFGIGLQHVARSMSHFPVELMQMPHFWSKVVECAEQYLRHCGSSTLVTNTTVTNETVALCIKASEHYGSPITMAGGGSVSSGGGIDPHALARGLCRVSGLLCLVQGDVSASRRHFERLVANLSIGAVEVQEALVLQHQLERQLLAKALDSALTTTKSTTNAAPPEEMTQDAKDEEAIRRQNDAQEKEERTAAAVEKKKQAQAAADENPSLASTTVAPGVLKKAGAKKNKKRIIFFDEMQDRLEAQEEERRRRRRSSLALVRRLPTAVLEQLVPAGTEPTLENLFAVSERLVEQYPLQLNDAQLKESPENVALWVQRFTLLGESSDQADEVKMEVELDSLYQRAMSEVGSQNPSRWLIPVAYLRQLSDLGLDEKSEALVEALLFGGAVGCDTVLLSYLCHTVSDGKIVVSLLHRVTAPVEEEVDQYRAKRRRGAESDATGSAFSSAETPKFGNLFGALVAGDGNIEDGDEPAAARAPTHLCLHPETWELRFQAELGCGMFEAALKTLQLALQHEILSPVSIGRMLRQPGSERLPTEAVGDLLAASLSLAEKQCLRGSGGTNSSGASGGPAIGVLAFTEFSTWCSGAINAVSGGGDSSNPSAPQSLTAASAGRVEWARECLEGSLQRMTQRLKADPTFSPQQLRACYSARAEFEVNQASPMAAVENLVVGIHYLLNNLNVALSKGYLLTSARHYEHALESLKELAPYASTTMKQAQETLGHGVALSVGVNLVTRVQAMLHGLVALPVLESKQRRLLLVVEGTLLLLTDSLLPLVTESCVQLGSLGQARSFYRMATHYAAVVLKTGTGDESADDATEEGLQGDGNKKPRRHKSASLVAIGRHQLQDSFEAWKAFEVSHGTDDTLADMIRIGKKTMASVEKNVKRRVNNSNPRDLTTGHAETAGGGEESLNAAE